MNWILLIIAGLFEAAFAFCLGKAKMATGNDIYLWYGGFFWPGWTAVIAAEAKGHAATFKKYPMKDIGLGQ